MSKLKVVDQGEQKTQEPTVDPREAECLTWRFKFAEFVDKAATLSGLSSADNAELDALLAKGGGLAFAPRIPGVNDRSAWQRFEAALINYANKLRSRSRTELSTGGVEETPSLESPALREKFARHGLTALELLDAALEDVRRKERRHAARLSDQRDLLHLAYEKGGEVLTLTLDLLAEFGAEIQRLDALKKIADAEGDVREQHHLSELLGMHRRARKSADEVLRHVRSISTLSGLDVSGLIPSELEHILVDPGPIAERGDL